MNSRGEAYQGHEVWWNGLRMHYKMLIHSVLWGIAFQVVAYICLLIALADNDGIIFAIRTCTASFLGKLPFTTKILFSHFSDVIDYPVEATENVNLQLNWLISVYYKSLPVLPVVTLGAIEYFRRKGEEQARPEYIRGAILRTPKEVNREIRQTKLPIDFAISDVNIRIEDEIQHFFTIGRPRQGKTQFLNPVIAKAKRRPGARGIIFDFKGQFWAQFGDPGKGDKLFNPLDVRSLRWSIFRDIRRITDIELIANSMIPQPPPNTDPIWTEAARDILYSILYYCYLNDRRTNKDVWQCISSPASELKSKFDSTPGCERGSKHLADPESRQATGFMTELMVYGKSFQYLASLDIPENPGDFSVIDWLYDENCEGWLFVASYADVRDALRPATSLFIELLIAKHLSMQEDIHRRIYYFLDEMSALGKLSSIESALNQGAGKGASVWLLIQAFGQLDAIYGRDVRDAIISGCGTSVIFSVSDPNTAKALSEKIGDTEYWEKEVAKSYGVGNNRDGENVRRTKRCEKLFLPVQLMQLKKFECVVLLPEFGATRTKIKYKNFPMLQEPFLIKPEFDMETIAADFRLLKAQISKYREKTPQEIDYERQETGANESVDDAIRRDIELDVDQY
jgi:hypothetical protein